MQPLRRLSPAPLLRFLFRRLYFHKPYSFQTHTSSVEIPILNYNLCTNNTIASKHNSQWGTTAPVSLITLDTVSFSAKKQKPIKDLRLIPDIPCACCGITTISNPEIDKFLNKKIYYPAKQALTILKKAGYFNKKFMSPTENDAYTFCKMCALLFENETLSEIIEKEDIKELQREHFPDVRSQIDKIEKMTKQLARNSSYMVRELEPYSSKMGKAELEVFEILKKESKKYPQKTFSEILSSPKLKEHHLNKLESKQNEVFAKVINIAAKMSPDSFNLVLGTVSKARKIFDASQTPAANKRTTVIESFVAIKDSIPEKKLMQELILEINNLPSSRNNASSFIIKYAECIPNVIVEQLLRGSSATHEHVKPKNRENDKGANDKSNYIILCRNCNSERARTPYSDFVKVHPSMSENLQKYLNRVIAVINQGLLIGFDKYPLEIIDAIDKESNGAIKLHYNKLNLVEANKNRKNLKIK